MKRSAGRLTTTQTGNESGQSITACWSKGEWQVLWWPPPWGWCHYKCSCHQAPTNIKRTPRHNLTTAILRRVTTAERQVTHATNRITWKSALHTITPVPSAAYLITMSVYVASPGRGNSQPHLRCRCHTRCHCCLWCPVFCQWCFTTHGHKRNHTRPPHLQSVLWCMGEVRIRPPTHCWHLAQSNPRGRPCTWPLYPSVQCYQFRHLPCHGWQWLPVLPGWHETPI